MDDRLSYWPDAYCQAIVEADPRSGLFREFLDTAMRLELDTPDVFFSSADIAAVMDERGVTGPQLADHLGVPKILIAAIARGWHRLGIRSLALVADALGVPLADFYLEPGGDQRRLVCQYRLYRQVLLHVKTLGTG